MNESTVLQKETILFVDDEENILRALKRIVRPLNYEVLTATSGKEGLQLLTDNAVDVVVSDMRMPEMTGAEFLENVANGWPNTIRILLTGYADLESTVRAINQGKIFNHISKPWDDNNIKSVLQQAMRISRLEKEREYLQLLTEKQNGELKSLNEQLEEKVRERTEELREAYTQLQNSHRASIPVFSNLVELHERRHAGTCQKIAALSTKIAEKLSLSEETCEQIYFASLLHNIGKMGIIDDILLKPYSELTRSEKETLERYPMAGEMALSALDTLQEAASYIRFHRERRDGSGYPDQAKQADIPEGAIIVAIAVDYYQLQLGLLEKECLEPKQAARYIKERAESYYTPEIYEAFQAVLQSMSSEDATLDEVCLAAGELNPGMLLARDLTTPDGILLLPAGQPLTGNVISKLQNMEKSYGNKLAVYVKKQ